MVFSKTDINPYSIKKFGLWLVFYCYSTFAAFLFRKVLSGLLPNLHAAKGFVGPDSLLYNDIALSLANSIRLHGWGQWTLHPAEGVTGNVSLLAALYVIFGDDPTIIIPINAAVHAVSGLLIYLIARLIWPGKTGEYSGLIVSSLFIVFPSALSWYSQIPKDGFAILGMLIICYSWLKLTAQSSKRNKILWVVVGNMLGLLLISFVRSYNVMILIFCGVVSYFVVLFYFLIRKRNIKIFYYFIIIGILLGIIGSLTPSLKKHRVIEQRNTLVELVRREGMPWYWERTRVIPESVDKMFESVASIRVISIYHSKKMNARSLLDENITPNNIWSSLAYLPRAGFIALFSPFPTMWFENRFPHRIAAFIETSIWYLIAPGLFLAFYYRINMPMILLALNSLIFLSMIGFVTPNIGTLYRFRYIYIFMLMLLGMIGWIEFIRRKFKHEHGDASRIDDATESNIGENNNSVISSMSRSAVVTSGIGVIVFTLIFSILFVIRDIILAKWFGFGNELDAFFISFIVPMFLVNVLGIPIGTVMVPKFIESFKDRTPEETQRIISVSSIAIFYMSAGITLFLYITSRYYLPILGWNFTAEKLILSHRLLMIMLPMFFGSGFIILGSSILNARQKFALPAIAQTIVPIIAIMFIFMFSHRFGIFAIAVGTIAGQFAHLLIINHYVGKEGYQLLKFDNMFNIRKLHMDWIVEFKNIFGQYNHLILAALFLTLSIPINNMMAASLDPGSVSSFNLGTKVVTFFTGLISTALSAVMLPYFSHFLTRNQIKYAQRELSYFLFVTTVVSLPITFIILIMGEPLIKVILQGGIVSSADVTKVTTIMNYSILQIPFFCANLMFIKFVNARQKNSIVTLSSIVGLTTNIIFNLILMRYLGVSGIALATSLSVLFSTAIIVAILKLYKDINHFDMIFTFLSWLVYSVILLYYNYYNALGIITGVIFLAVTFFYYFSYIFKSNRVKSG